MPEDTTALTIEGEVDQVQQVSIDAFRAIGDQVTMDAIDPKRAGQSAVKLRDVLSICGIKSTATHLGLHGSRDDFHASIPLEPVLDRGLLIYEHEGEPLPVSAGGPFRFFIPDHAACRMDEIDECANVKFLDRIELTAGRGFDNRPQDEDEHAKLHERQNEDA